MHLIQASSMLRKLICTLLVPILLIGALCTNSQARDEPLQLQMANSGILKLVVKASNDAAYQTEAVWTNKKLLRELKVGRTGSPYIAPLPPDTTIFFENNGQLQRFGVTPYGEVINPSLKQSVTLSRTAQDALRAQVQSLRAKHFGELLPWEEASKILPKYSTFTILDVESGLSFEGQRRAGSHHADVQPLTKEDSATLKSIYGGAWSWDRKAVLVKLNGRTLAGSMHGMPHGGDGIPGNDFKGHFCIHFLGSTTHGSRLVDPMHQVMVHRAAGLLTDYISKLSPWALIDLWISAANQGDLQLLQVTTGQEQALHARSMRRLSKLPEQDVSQLLQVDATVDIAATPERASAVVNRRVIFRLERSSLDTRWYIRSADMQ